MCPGATVVGSSLAGTSIGVMSPTWRQRRQAPQPRFDVRVSMPDWKRVAHDWDGVHLSWAGMLTCEGHVIDVPALGSDVVTMLRFWFTERTLWLRSSPFGQPTGLHAATLTGQLESTTVSTVDGPLPDFATWPI